MENFSWRYSYCTRPNYIYWCYQTYSLIKFSLGRGSCRPGRVGRSCFPAGRFRPEGNWSSPFLDSTSAWKELVGPRTLRHGWKCTPLPSRNPEDYIMRSFTYGSICMALSYSFCLPHTGFADSAAGTHRTPLSWSWSGSMPGTFPSSRGSLGECGTA